MQMPIGSRARADGDALRTLAWTAARPGRLPSPNPFPPRSARGRKKRGYRTNKKKDTGVVPPRRPPLRALFLLLLFSISSPCHVKLTARHKYPPSAQSLPLHPSNCEPLVPRPALVLLLSSWISPFVRFCPFILPLRYSSIFYPFSPIYPRDHAFPCATPALLLPPCPSSAFSLLPQSYLDHDPPKTWLVNLVPIPCCSGQFGFLHLRLLCSSL